MNKKLAIGVTLAGTAVLGAIAVSYSNAQSGEFSASEKAAIEEIVRDYIAEHPDEVIEALNAYLAEKQAAAMAKSKEEAESYARANLDALVDERFGASAGANLEEATVAVIEFFDYHCGFCKRSTPFVKELTRSDPAVKVIFRELPILRQESGYAAQAALAARAQGKYVDFHFALMEANGLIDEARVAQIAKETGLDVAAIQAEADNPEHIATIDETHRIAEELAIEGTPAFVIASLNGDFVEIVHGANTSAVKDAIEKAKKAARQ